LMTAMILTSTAKNANLSKIILMMTTKLSQAVQSFFDKYVFQR
jgi:hypothetical protein